MCAGAATAADFHIWTGVWGSLQPHGDSNLCGNEGHGKRQVPLKWLHSTIGEFAYVNNTRTSLPRQVPSMSCSSNICALQQQAEVIDSRLAAGDMDV